MLVGPSAAGKSTWAAGRFEDNEIVSSDSLRAVVGAGEDDQVAGTAAFELLELIVAERLRRRMTTVIDTLGLDSDRRRRWLETARANDVPAHIVVFDTSRSVAESRNGERTRPIPKTVLGKQFSTFRKVRPSLDGDGFDAVHEIVTSDREPSASPTPSVETGHTFGLMVSRFNWVGDDFATNLTGVARRAEAAGFRDLWVMDHFRQIPQVGRAWEDIPEAYSALGYVAGVTDEIRLGVLVTAVTHRQPVVLGKAIATLDVLSGGRANAGLGVGWDKAEHAAYGIEFPSTSERYEMLEETLQMLPLLWGKGTPSFDGDHIRAESLTCYPRPIQEPIPTLIGGSGERKTLRLVALYADMCNLFGKPDRIRHKVDVLQRHCAEVDRDPDEIEVTHLTDVLVAANYPSLRARVEELRDRNVPAETYMGRINAGTPNEVIEFVAEYSDAGARHTIVSMPDVSLDGSIETFGDVIAGFDDP